jgi:predicted RecA/RadA family phage recombinase
MSTTSRESGKTILFTNSTGNDIAVNSVVVIGSLLAIATVNIPDGESGECSVEGVHKLPKTAGVVFDLGEKLIWDVSAGAFIKANATPAAGDISGAAICWAAAVSGATVCYVKINPALGTVETG